MFQRYLITGGMPEVIDAELRGFSDNELDAIKQKIIDIYEKDVNLEICLKLQKVLESEGAIVYLTRYGDYDLSNNTLRYVLAIALTPYAQIIRLDMNIVNANYDFSISQG